MGSGVRSWPPVSSTGELQLDLSLWDTRKDDLPPGAKKVFNSYFSRLREEETCYEIQYGLNETTFTVDDGEGVLLKATYGNSGI